MTATELRAAGSLASIYFLRMFGLFIILPVFSLQARELAGATPFLVGLALGAYGITQALLQIPFGMLSDRFGRRSIISLGLLVFIFGSAVAALSDNITGMIIGRVLQGAGAIAAAVMALAADLTREEQRTKTMAVIGVSIGIAFMTAFIIGPIICDRIGLEGLFWTTATLALVALGVLHFVVPKASGQQFHPDCQSDTAQLVEILKHPQLLRINTGILLLHAILTASFVVLPLALRDHAGLEPLHHWKVYLPVMALSVVFMFPFILLADKRRRAKLALAGAIGLLMVSEVGLFFGFQTLTALVVSMVLFFTAFNFLEANLPSLVSRIAPADRRGSAMGVYSSCQFIGAFIGGAGGGWLHGRQDLGGVFLFCALLALVWLLAALTMSPPGYLKTRMIRLGALTKTEVNDSQLELIAIPGVTEAVVDPRDGVAYLKVDPDTLDRQSLERFTAARKPTLGRT